MTLRSQRMGRNALRSDLIGKSASGICFPDTWLAASRPSLQMPIVRPQSRRTARFAVCERSATNPSLIVWERASRMILTRQMGFANANPSDCALALSPDGRIACWGGRLGTPRDDLAEIRIWHERTGKVESIWQGAALGVEGIGFSRDGKFVAAHFRRRVHGRVTNWIQSFELNSETTARPLFKVEMDHRVTKVAFVGQCLLAGDDQGCIYDIPMRDPQQINEIGVVLGWVDLIVVSRDERQFACSSKLPVANKPPTVTLSLWNSQSKQKSRSWTAGASVDSAAFTSDSSTLVTGSTKGLRTLAVEDIQEVQACAYSDATEMWCVRFSPRGDLLAAAGEKKWLRLLNPTTGKIVTALRGHDALVSCVAWTPDGEILISGGYEKKNRNRPSHNLRLWSRDGTSMGTFEGTAAPVKCVAISDDGRTVAAGGKDRIVSLFDLGSRKLIRQLKPNEDNVMALFFLPVGDLLFSLVDDTGTARLWNWRTGDRLDS